MNDVERFFRESLRKAAHKGGNLDTALLELGWLDALAEDPRLAVSVLFEVQGESLTTSSALNAVLARSLGVSGAVLVPITKGRGLLLQAADTALAATGERVVEQPVSTTPVRGLDPSLGLLMAQATDAGTPVECTGTWAAALDAGRVALAYELVGASAAMLRLAVEHAKSREQGGRFIAGFQAIRHRLAESHVAVEAARASADAAWDSPGPWSSAMAKAVAGTSARTVAKHAQQVLAGMGFTTEHPFHLYLRRVRVLDQLLGSSATLTRELGAQVLAERTLPAVVPL